MHDVDWSLFFCAPFLALGALLWTSGFLMRLFARDSVQGAAYRIQQVGLVVLVLAVVGLFLMHWWFEAAFQRQQDAIPS